MTAAEASKIAQMYDEYDTNFRNAKKRKDFKVASAWKSKRDALSTQLSEALAVLREAK